MQSKTRSVEAPPPPPETFGAYSKKSEESGGVIGMMDMMIKDVNLEIQEMKLEEQDAQEEYETMVKEAADKRAADTLSIEQKEAAKADLEDTRGDNGQKGRGGGRAHG